MYFGDSSKTGKLISIVLIKEHVFPANVIHTR
jgi:hypothetical protein